MITRRDALKIPAAMLALGASVGALTKRVGAKEPARATEVAMHDDRLDWWQAARFGLFVHWGPYSVAGVEASWPIMVPALASLVPQPSIREADYVALASRFDPREFEPKAWVALARRAGMRYVVFTAKHHDGFCMFDADGSDYKITRSPYGRDKAVAFARRAGAGRGRVSAPSRLADRADRDPDLRLGGAVDVPSRRRRGAFRPARRRPPHRSAVAAAP